MNTLKVNLDRCNVSNETLLYICDRDGELIVEIEAGYVRRNMPNLLNHVALLFGKNDNDGRYYVELDYSERD